jgi:hypothetical protein
MSELPHDISDLYLAPVVLELEARINGLAQLNDEKLALQVALESNEPDWTADMRRDAILRTVAHLVDLHGWRLAWDVRGIRASHGKRSFVIGVPASFHRYVGVSEPESLTRDGDPSRHRVHD